MIAHLRHAQWRSIHHQVAALQQGFERFIAAAEHHWGCPAADIGRQGFQLAAVAPAQHHLLNSQLAAAAQHGSHHAAAAQDQGLAAPLQAPAQGGEKSTPVGVGAAPAALAIGDQAVHSTELACHAINAAQQGLHCFFVRNGDAETAAAQGSQALDGLLQSIGCHRKGEITPVQPQLSEGRVVHHRREGVVDGLADHP